MTTQVWFKRDLRMRDHAPLTHAAAQGPVIALYIYEPIITHATIFDTSHLEFLNQCLASLQSDLNHLGITLTLRVGHAVEVLTELRKEAAFSMLVSHEETGNGATYTRDVEVKKWCVAHDIHWHEWLQNGVVRRLKSRNGWAKQWDVRMTQPCIVPICANQTSPIIKTVGLLHAQQLSLPSNIKRIQRGGREAAVRLLDSFLETRSHNYQREMSSPESAWTSCSRLSTHLAFGTISLKEVTQQCATKQIELRERAQSGEPLPVNWRRSLQSFQARLHWHCHFIQKLEDEPSIEFENFSRCFDGMRPLEADSTFNHEYYAAWCEGRTGYPMVDACMRALLQTGWINFRMRAMLVSFASYQLWLDWRPVARHLAKHFLDYEAGIHYSQCQMQSGTTGINIPRMYSPIKQAVENDPAGTFIKRFLPELADVPIAVLAEPHRLNTHEELNLSKTLSYPTPIVDHKVSLALARNRYAVYRNAAPAKNEAKQVLQKHGSRKSGLKQMTTVNKNTRNSKLVKANDSGSATQLSLLDDLT